MIPRPLFLSKVPAGFPSPADDYVDARLDLNERLVRHPAATFFVRVEGDSMIGAGIHSGDTLVVVGRRGVQPTVADAAEQQEPALYNALGRAAEGLLRESVALAVRNLCDST